MRAAWCGVDSQLFTMRPVDNFRLWGFPALGEIAHYRAGGNPSRFGYLELEEMQSTPSDAGEQQSHPWYVAHTRPRCEKKLVAWCGRAEHASELPTYASVRKYRGKEVTFHKPLFPGYVFLRLPIQGKREVMQSDYVANLLAPPDQAEFEAQLADILQALETMEDVWLVPNIGVGTRVLIQRGPLAGLEAWVEDRHGPATALLRLDFIGQAAAVKVSVEDLELV
jgi:transcription antitermination factor NusG